MSDIEYLDDIADQSAFSRGDGGYLNGMAICKKRKQRSGMGKCGKGHDLTPENVRKYRVGTTKRWRWVCRTCENAERRARRARKAAAAQRAIGEQIDRQMASL